MLCLQFFACTAWSTVNIWYHKTWEYACKAICLFQLAIVRLAGRWIAQSDDLRNITCILIHSSWYTDTAGKNKWFTKIVWLAALAIINLDMSSAASKPLPALFDLSLNICLNVILVWKYSRSFCFNNIMICPTCLLS